MALARRGALVALVALTACAAPQLPAETSASAGQPVATIASPTGGTAASPAGTDLPIVDLHFHIDPRWSAAALASVLGSTGVSKAANGGFGSDELVLALASAVSGQRVLPFAGLTPIRSLTQQYGERAWTLEEPSVASYIDALERSLRSGAYRGIGELFVNNVNSHPANVVATRYPADSPLMRRIWAMSARYGVPMSVHMEADADMVAGMESLLGSDARGSWLWAHCGVFATPDIVGPLLERHPNLHCELSFRDEVRRSTAPIDRGGTWVPQWRELVERLPDRFSVGTDTGSTDPLAYTAAIAYWRRLLAQLSPRARALVAHENAERLMRLSPAR